MAESVSYHNTTDITDQSQLQKYVVLAERQEQTIIRYAMDNPDLHFYDGNIKHLFSPGVPVTSIRRAVCNLYNAGKLIRAGKTTGPYGRPVYTYKLRSGGLL